MKTINEEMMSFKEAIRHVWNQYFLRKNSVSKVELLESFSLIEMEMFRALVLRPLSINAEQEDYHRCSSFIALQAKPYLSFVPVTFGVEDENKNIAYKPECSVPASEISSYKFMDFFDWDQYGYIDLHFIRAYADSNTFALIPSTYVDFVLREC